MLKYNLVGQTFGKLSVIRKSDQRAYSKVLWDCLCECGSITKSTTGHLMNGHTTSCGCNRREVARTRAVSRNTTHGLSKFKFYGPTMANKRRAAKSKRTPAWSNLDKISEIYKECPDGYHVDHIIPLRGKLVSGLHVPENLQYLTAADNLRKKNKFIPYVESNDQLQFIHL